MAAINQTLAEKRAHREGILLQRHRQLQLNHQHTEAQLAKTEGKLMADDEQYYLRVIEKNLKTKLTREKIARERI